MILFQGKTYPNQEQEELLKNLPHLLIQTLKQVNPLTTDKVINACDELASKVMNGRYDDILKPLLIELDISEETFFAMVKLFSKEAMTYKCKVELGSEITYNDSIKRERYPLGILFHIAAGNVDGLPAYSVIEGLLVGNINILKLPAGDQGLSIFILNELINIEPDLTEYIYVFDVPSTELETLKQLANLSDAVVVWGGDVAVKAVREMVDVKTKIIAWGHKLSFAYATLDVNDEELIGLANHICETNQLLCSSCQGIYIDTENKEDLENFAKRFFQIFKTVNQNYKPIPYGMKARNSLYLYNEQLEQHQTKHRIYMDHGCSVIVKDDYELELSYMFRNVWIKRLPRGKIVETLKHNKNHLQTVGLCVKEEDKKDLSVIFIKTGLVKITRGENMSRMFAGEAHDGTYPLREYSRIVEIY